LKIVNIVEFLVVEVEIMWNFMSPHPEGEAGNTKSLVK
jgi:hypothetical protein